MPYLYDVPECPVSLTGHRCIYDMSYRGCPKRIAHGLHGYDGSTQITIRDYLFNPCHSCSIGLI